MNAVDFLLNRLIPDADHCRASVAALRAEHPGLLPLELADIAVRSAKRRAAATGAATGIASSPLTMIPAALAWLSWRQCCGSRERSSARLPPCSIRNRWDDPNTLRMDVISVIFPAAASQALRQVGIRAGERLSQAAMRKYATEDLIRNISRLATRYLGKQLTRETVVAKSIPIVGMGIGAGWNWLEVKAIGHRAVEYYGNGPIVQAPALVKRDHAAKGVVGREILDAARREGKIRLNGLRPITNVTGAGGGVLV